MALIIETNIACDECGKLFRPTTLPIKGKELRKLTRAAGWVRPKNGDVCPACADRINPRANKIHVAKLIHLRFAGIKPEGGKNVRIDEYELQWPGHKLDKQVVYRRSVIDVTPNGYERTRCTYKIGQTGKVCRTIKKLIDHYKDL